MRRRSRSCRCTKGRAGGAARFGSSFPAVFQTRVLPWLSWKRVATLVLLLLPPSNAKNQLRPPTPQNRHYARLFLALVCL